MSQATKDAPPTTGVKTRLWAVQPTVKKVRMSRSHFVQCDEPAHSIFLFRRHPRRKSAIMAPIDKKRKSGPTNESFARSRKPAEDGDRPSKRHRADEKDGKSIAPKAPLVPKISRAREEEAAFPRGGASILTPLEHKQIQIEAARDVLFEQESGKSARLEEDGAGEEAAIRKKSKSKSKGKGKKGTENAEPEEESVKIEGLSYKVCSELCINVPS